VTHTEAHKQQAAIDYRLPPGSIHVVPHGVAPLLASQAVKGSQQQVLCVGSASPRKGVALFLEVADRVAREVPTVQFLWVGKDTPTAPGGRTWATYRREQYPYLNNVSFIESVADDGLAKAYAQSCVYLCTSVYESFGLTLVEAMHAGLPVIAPSTPAISELVVNRRTGLLYSPGDARQLAEHLVGLLFDRAAARDLGLAGRARAETHYSVEQMATMMRNIYESVR
jgi:glycosyltransferase involved in cell wall biosynthesis